MATAASVTKAHSGMFTSASVEWYTPPDLLAEVREFLGGTFYDPCPPPMQTEGAGVANVTSLHGRENGLAVARWLSPSWLNPPYGREIARWVKRAVSESDLEIVMLLPSRTDTSWFQLCWPHSVCFIRGRLHFSTPGAPARKLDGAPFPSALVYRNDRHPERHAEFARAFAHCGVTVQRMPSFARLEQQQCEREAAAAVAARGRHAMRQPVLIAAS